MGEIVTLSYGDSVAEITTTGAHLRRFDVGSRQVIVPFGNELPWGAHGAILAPWPNRVDSGRYLWDGHEYQLAVNETKRSTAIHGLVMWTQWQVVNRSADRVQLATHLPASPGYPFPLDFTLTYALGAAALSIECSVRNVGQRRVPFGIGFHPWLASGPEGLDAAELYFEASTWYQSDERLLPTAELRVPESFDFRKQRAVGKTRFDDAFGGPRYDETGRSWVHLVGDDGYTASAWMTEPLRIWQLCSEPGPDPRALAAEPMTCAANAFNTGTDLHTLSPDEPLTVKWGLTLTSHDTV